MPPDEECAPPSSNEISYIVPRYPYLRYVRTTHRIGRCRHRPQSRVGVGVVGRPVLFAFECVFELILELYEIRLSSHVAFLGRFE